MFVSDGFSICKTCANLSSEGNLISNNLTRSNVRNSIKTHPLGTMNVSIKFHCSNPLNSC